MLHFERGGERESERARANKGERWRTRGGKLDLRIMLLLDNALIHASVCVCVSVSYNRRHSEQPRR